jgi:hypothetical protein
VKRWYETIAKRPAVQKGYQVPKDMGPIPMPLATGLKRIVPFGRRGSARNPGENFCAPEWAGHKSDPIEHHGWAIEIRGTFLSSEHRGRRWGTVLTTELCFDATLARPGQRNRSCMVVPGGTFHRIA